MSEKDRLVFLDQMRYAARRAIANVEGLGVQDFLEDLTSQEAATMNLLQIGEMANRLARDHADFLRDQGDLPVEQMRGMRNRIAHGYFQLDMKVVWDTIVEQLPPLLAQLDRILDNGRQDGQG